MRRYVTARIAAFVILAGLFSACGSGSSITTRATPPTEATSAPTRTPRPQTTSPTDAPTVTLAPTSLPTPLKEPAAPQPTEQVIGTPTNLTRYTAPDGSWSVDYPATLLYVEQLSHNVTIFISQDRSTFAAVDTYLAEGNAYGNTGEDLRNRARDTLRLIYGVDVNGSDQLLYGDSGWETGFTFTTDKGSAGEALYEQRGFEQGDNQVFGFLFGHKIAVAEEMQPVLLAMRASFTRR